jgi:hypothetical protein
LFVSLGLETITLGTERGVATGFHIADGNNQVPRSKIANMSSSAAVGGHSNANTTVVPGKRGAATMEVPSSDDMNQLPKAKKLNAPAGGPSNANTTVVPGKRGAATMEVPSSDDMNQLPKAKKRNALAGGHSNANTTVVPGKRGAATMEVPSSDDMNQLPKAKKPK